MTVRTCGWCRSRVTPTEVRRRVGPQGCRERVAGYGRTHGGGGKTASRPLRSPRRGRAAAYRLATVPPFFSASLTQASSRSGASAPVIMRPSKMKEGVPLTPSFSPAF